MARPISSVPVSRQPTKLRLALNPLLAAMLLATSQAPLLAAEAESQPQPQNGNSTIEELYIRATTRGTYSEADTLSATRLVLSLRETPQAVTVITQQQMEDWAAFNIKDIIGRTTGIYTSTGSSQDRPSFNVRGGPVNLIRVDNVQQFPGGQRPNVNGDSIAYERVEILRGANGLMTGVGDPTASINMVRKRANDVDFSGHVAASSATWNNQRVEFDVSRRLDSDGDVRGRLAAAHYDRESFLDRYGQRKTSVYGTVEADLTENTLARVGVEWADTASRGAINTNAAPYYFSDGSLVNPPRDFTGMSASWSGWPLDEKTYFVGIDHSFANDWHLSAITTLNTIEMSGGSLFFFFPFDYINRDGSGRFEYSTVIASSEDEQKTYDITLQGPFQLFDREHQFVVGYSYFDRSRTSFGFNANQAVLSKNQNAFTWNGEIEHFPFQNLGRASEATTTSGGAFFAARFTLLEPLKLIAGARVTDWETYTDAYNANTGAYLRTTGKYDVSDELTPYAGLVYDINDTTSAYVSYTDAFQPQNLFDANDNVLEPVVGKSYEVGAKAELFDGDLNLGVAYFESERDNVGIIDPAYAPGFLTPEGRTPYISSGKGNRTEGYELEAVGRITAGWNVYGGYSHTETRNNIGTTINTEIPQDLFNINTTYRLPDNLDSWTVGMGANWQSDYWVNAQRPTGEARRANGTLPTRAERRVQDSLVLVNMLVRYEFNDNLSMSFNANNLFDEEYFSSIQASNGSVTWAEPRSYRLTARYSF